MGVCRTRLPRMTIRSAVRGDAELLFGLIQELAEYEKLGAAVRGDAELLARTMFDRGAAEALIAEVDGEAVGYAIFFGTFSTFECRSGIWVEWSALDWNEPALRFYEELGATRLEEWLTLRLDGQGLERLGVERSSRSQ